MAQATIDAYSEIKDRFAVIFNDHEASLNGHKSHPLQEIRRRALEKLAQTPFPDRKSEDWKYTAVSPVLKPAYEYSPVINDTLPHALENPIGFGESIRIVFVNGHLVTPLASLRNANNKLTISIIEDAIESDHFGSFIRSALDAQIEHPGNAFELLNIAFNRQGLFIHVPKNRQVATPVEILYVNTESESPYFLHPQIMVQAETGSRLRIVERYEHDGPSQASMTNAWHHFNIGENARLDYAKFQREAPTANHIHQIRTRQAANSRYDSYVLDTGGKTVRNTHSTYLDGQNTETHLLGNYISTGSQSIDNQTFIDHAIPHCFSNELYKGIAAERGKGVFNGKILVRQDAQKTNAFQQNANMVLSPHAVVNAKPQLEIFADDVKCSHGATIGQLDEKAVFYLRTRGLTDVQARRMLQKAFVDEVVDHVEFEEIQAFAHRIISEKLSRIDS